MRTLLVRLGSTFGERAGACALLGAFIFIGHSLVERPAIAQPATDQAQKDAFAAAKELGTVEAWEAFLANYPTGFHADLARAYVKKLGGAGAQPAATTHQASDSRPATELPCAEAIRSKSQQSAQPAKIRFVNESDATLVIQWIDFDGALKEYGELKPGEQMTQETFMTHPWIAAYQEGSCRQLFMPTDGLSIARLAPENELPRASKSGSSDEDAHNGAGAKAPTKKKASKAAIERRAKAACADIGMIYLNGKCAPKYRTQRDYAKKKKNAACPSGMYRNPYGQCQPNETGG